MSTLIKKTTKNGSPRPADNSEVLINAINKYGREQFARDVGVKLSTVNQVCANYRSLGISNAWRAMQVLDLPLSACVSQAKPSK